MPALIARTGACATSAMRRNTCRAVLPARPRHCRVMRPSGGKVRTGTVVVRAEFQDGPKENPLSTFLARYDFTSAMMGALVVTGLFWSMGQDPLQALSITACSTVFAVVANELLFSNEDKL